MMVAILALLSVLPLPVAVVHWLPAQGIFRTTAVAAGRWLLVTLAATSVLPQDEVRKGE